MADGDRRDCGFMKIGPTFLLFVFPSEACDLGKVRWVFFVYSQVFYKKGAF